MELLLLVIIVCIPFTMIFFVLFKEDDEKKTFTYVDIKFDGYDKTYTYLVKEGEIYQEGEEYYVISKKTNREKKIKIVRGNYEHKDFGYITYLQVIDKYSANLKKESEETFAVLSDKVFGTRLYQVKPGQNFITGQTYYICNKNDKNDWRELNVIKGNYKVSSLSFIERRAPYYYLKENEEIVEKLEFVDENENKNFTLKNNTPINKVSINTKQNYKNYRHSNDDFILYGTNGKPYVEDLSGYDEFENLQRDLNDEYRYGNKDRPFIYEKFCDTYHYDEVEDLMDIVDDEYIYMDDYYDYDDYLNGDNDNFDDYY